MAKDAFEVAVKLLGGREKSRAQLEAALIQRDFTVAEIRDALRRCEELKYLDDDRTARSLAIKLLAEHRSCVDVEQRLEAKGLPIGIVAQLQPDDAPAAEALLKSKRVSGVKAARLLLSRGFEEELVTRLVDVPDADE